MAHAISDMEGLLRPDKGSVFPDMRQLHQAYPIPDPTMLNSMMLIDPAFREKMVQDAAKVDHPDLVSLLGLFPICG